MTPDATTTVDDAITMSPAPASSTKSDVAALYSSVSNGGDDDDDDDDYRHDEIAHRLSAMLERERSPSCRVVDYVACDRDRRYHDDCIDCDDCDVIDDEEEEEEEEARRRRRQEHRSSRRKMHAWCVRLCDVAGASRLAASRAMDLLDRSLSAAVASSPPRRFSSRDEAEEPALMRLRRAIHDKREYQLLSMTCLYLSVKLHEQVGMPASLFAEVSRGCYSPSDFAEMETTVLRALDWRVLSGAHTSQEAACLLLGAIDPGWCENDHLDAVRELLDGCMYMCELASGDYDLSVGGGGPIVVGLATVLDGLVGRVARGGGGDEEYRNACEFLRMVCDHLVPGVDLSEVARARARLLELVRENDPTTRCSELSSARRCPEAGGGAMRESGGATREEETMPGRHGFAMGCSSIDVDDDRTTPIPIRPRGEIPRAIVVRECRPSPVSVGVPVTPCPSRDDD
jgi:hypothetical protein